MHTKIPRHFLVPAFTLAGLVLLSHSFAQQHAKPAATQSAADGDTRDQFKFTGGEKPLGDTALHKDWKLIWEDDFSRDKQIDPSKWTFEIDGKGGGIAVLHRQCQKRPHQRRRTGDHRPKGR
jgi:hypothetical protein